MVEPFLKQEELIALLNKNDFEVCSDEYWEEYDRVIFKSKRDGHTFPLQMRKVYFFNHVVRLCDSLGIAAPEDHREAYESFKTMQARRNK